MEGREGCPGMFLGMFIVCPVGMSRAEKGQGSLPGVPGNGSLPTASQTCPKTQLPSWHKVLCVCPPPRRTGITPHPSTTSCMRGTGTAEAPREQPQPCSALHPPELAPFPWQGLGIRLQQLF